MTRPSEIGNLVLRVARRREMRPGGLIQLRLPLGIQFHFTLRESHPQRRVLLEGQAIGRDVIRSQGNDLIEIAEPVLLALPGRANIRSTFTLAKPAARTCS